MIAHIVLFTPKPDLSEEQIRSFVLAIKAGCEAAPAVRRAIVGKSVAINTGYDRNLGDKTYHFAAVFEFDTRADLVRYLTHPAHEVVGKLFWELCESTVVTEVEARDLADPGFVDFLTAGPEKSPR